MGGGKGGGRWCLGWGRPACLQVNTESTALAWPGRTGVAGSLIYTVHLASHPSPLTRTPPTPSLVHPHQLTDNVDFYNILLHNAPDNGAGLTFDPQALGGRHLSRLHQAALSALMNGPIKLQLKDIPDNVTWGGALPCQLISLAMAGHSGLVSVFPLRASRPSLLQTVGRLHERCRLNRSTHAILLLDKITLPPSLPPFLSPYS